MATTDVCFRYLQSEPSNFRKAKSGKRSLRVCFASETPVLRVGDGRIHPHGEPFYEVLSHDPEHADLSLLQNGGAFLDEHDPKRQIGSISRAWLDSDRRSRADLVFADTALGNERFALMSEGHRQDISFGYVLRKCLGESRAADGKPVKRFAWQATEISSVSLGADHFEAGVGRNHSPVKITSTRINTMPEHKPRSPEETRRAIIDIKEDFARLNPKMEPDLNALAARAIMDGMDIPAFKREANAIWERHGSPQNRFTPVGRDEEIGMTLRELGGFSFARGLRSAMENGGVPKNCPEADFHEQVKRSASFRGVGWMIPGDVIHGNRIVGYASGHRDFDGMQASSAALGGNFIGKDIMPVIDILRNRTIVQRLGATAIGGLRGTTAFPRQSSTVTAQSRAENQALDTSKMTIEQIEGTPRRVGVSTEFSKQLIIQSTPDAEGWIFNDCIKTVAVKHDSLLLNGAGENSEPVGLLNQSGIGTIEFGGAVEYGDLVDMETKIAEFNADSGMMAYATTPTVRGKLKKRALVLDGATTVASIPIWQRGNFSDGSGDGIVADHRAAATNQIPGNRIIFGDWTSLMYLTWGGWDLVLDVYTKAKEAAVVITINTWIDCLLRHPQSFVVSTDAGNQ